MGTESLLSLVGVRHEYRRGKEVVQIFDGLNLDVPQGAFVAIMGPSGSGKTTLLNLLGGLDRPARGEIRYRSERIDQYSESQMANWRARHVGFIFQFYNLIPSMSAERNVALPLMLTDLSRGDRGRHVSTALSAVGLSDRRRHLPSQLSGGQQQRVAIARAIVADAEVLLCDEPTGDLDRTTASEILDVLHTLNAEFGKTIVMVTHDPRAAARANRVLHLDKGIFSEQLAA